MITVELKLNSFLYLDSGILHLQHQELGKILNKLWPTFFIQRF